MMVARTVGGFMWTLSLPPTSSRTVAVNLESFLSTWGGCFSIMKVLQWINESIDQSMNQSIDQSIIKYYNYQLEGNINKLKTRCHLVTREESKPVMVEFNKGRRSCDPGGIAIGSWALSSSTFFICCLFCQMNSARLSHLDWWKWERLKVGEYSWIWAAQVLGPWHVLSGQAPLINCLANW